MSTLELYDTVEVLADLAQEVLTMLTAHVDEH